MNIEKINEGIDLVVSALEKEIGFAEKKDEQDIKYKINKIEHLKDFLNGICDEGKTINNNFVLRTNLENAELKSKFDEKVREFNKLFLS